VPKLSINVPIFRYACLLYHFRLDTRLHKGRIEWINLIMNRKYTEKFITRISHIESRNIGNCVRFQFNIV